MFLRLAALCFFLFLPLSYGADFHSPRSIALGGSAHAGPLLNDSLYLNPSHASFLPSYSLSMNYQKYKEPEGGSTRGHVSNLSIQDGRSELFQAGVGYTRREDANFIHVGASKAFLQQFGIGMGGKFYFVKYPNQKKGKLTQDATFSSTYAFSQTINLAFIVDNLNQTERGKQLGMYREFILGMKFNLDRLFLIYFDPHWVPEEPNQKHYGYEGGLEIPMMKDFFLRFGQYRQSYNSWLAKRGNGYGLGFGWIAPRVSLDYGYGKANSPVSAKTHHLGLTVFF